MLIQFEAGASILEWRMSLTANRRSPEHALSASRFTLRKSPLRVKRVTLIVGRSLPVFPEKRTISEAVGTSHSCQKRAFSTTAFIECRPRVRSLEGCFMDTLRQIGTASSSNNRRNRRR
jgi:hypothetical protein